MSKIRSCETTPEIAFRKSLWAKGIRYRKNNPKIQEKPDVSIMKYKIAIFIDGEFWHGYDWKNKKKKIKSNRDYWIPKIERNIERDKKTNSILTSDGWIVIRFWSNNVKKNMDYCINTVIKEIEKKRNEKL